MAGPFYFAWGDEATAWGLDQVRVDEDVFEVELSQDEGGFAVLLLDIRRPNAGLLAPGRQQWLWFSWFDGIEVRPLFHGRVMGAPENIAGEVWRLVFRARPSDYTERKAALAATLRVLPFWDPVWLVQQVDDPDTVLETRAASWHIDRQTLDLTISDWIEGEDGTIELDEGQHFYEGFDVSYGAQPRRRVDVKLTSGYTQAATGEVDLTDQLVAAFRAAGSPFPWPIVSSYTADGLLGDWPAPSANLSGGWSIAPTSTAAVAGQVAPVTYAVRYVDKTDNTSVEGVAQRDALGNALPGEIPRLFFINWKNYDVTFTCQPLLIDLKVAYAASRKRSEIVTFSVRAAAQSVVTDPDGAEIGKIELSSTFVDQPIDAGGALPIGDPRRNVYFPTDRGQLSIQFAMLLARAQLLFGARAVTIKLQSEWRHLAVAISGRKSILVRNRGLPGGQARGKIINYRMVANDRGENFVEAHIACTIGYGVALGPAAAGDDVYATGYSSGYTAASGREVPVIDGALHYQSLDGTYVVDDDGVDLFNMTPGAVIRGLTVTGGPNEQRAAIDGNLRNPGTRPAVDLVTTGDLAIDGLSVLNLASVEGLVSGGIYRIDGAGIARDFATQLPGEGVEVPNTTFTFDGVRGGALSRAANNGVFRVGVELRISTPVGADLGITPDPIAALRAAATVVNLDLVPVTGGDFLTLYEIEVRDLVIPQTINLEAA